MQGRVDVGHGKSRDLDAGAPFAKSAGSHLHSKLHNQDSCKFMNSTLVVPPDTLSNSELAYSTSISRNRFFLNSGKSEMSSINPSTTPEILQTGKNEILGALDNGCTSYAPNLTTGGCIAHEPTVEDGCAPVPGTASVASAPKDASSRIILTLVSTMPPPSLFLAPPRSHASWSFEQHRTYPKQIGINPLPLHWGHPDPSKRGPVVVSRLASTIRRRNGKHQFQTPNLAPGKV